jgi:hypothetical protein
MSWKTVAVLVLSLLSVTAFAGPDIDIEQDSYDFGKSVQKVVLTHDFWIKSSGEDTLRVTEIVPGCGCTESWLTDSTIAPGDSANLHIIFSTGRFSKHVSKQPYLMTNVSGERVYLKISAELEIEPEKSLPITISPSLVDVSQFDERPRRRSRFFIENRTDNNLKISVVDSSFKSFEVKVPKEVKAGESVAGLVIVFEGAVETSFEESITIELNDPGSSRYSIPVKRMLPTAISKTAIPGK